MAGVDLLAGTPMPKKGVDLLAQPTQAAVSAPVQQVPVAPPMSGAGPGGSDLRYDQPGFPQPKQQQRPDLKWGDVPGQALENTPESASKFVSALTHMVTHPYGTAKSITDIVAGVAQKTIPGLGNDQQGKAEAVGKFFADRYGDAEGLKYTLATDPVGVAADLSMFLTAGATAIAPVAAKTSKVASFVGRSIDPLNAAVIAPAKLASKAVPHILGGATGAGGRAIQEAAKAGAKGGRTGQAYRDQLRGIAPVQDVVTDAKLALSNMKQHRAAQYREGMAGVKVDTAAIDFGPIDLALDKVSKVGKFMDQTIRPKAVEAMNEIRAIVDEWKTLDPAVYHTPEGMDALKQKIGSVGEKFDPMTAKQARVITDQAYSAVKAEIVNQAPAYAKVMKDYERASELIRDIEKTLSVNPKANVDTIVRKLQSVMRNNATTNYGRRVDLAEKLSDAGAPELMPRLAGQALSSPMPRGIQGALAIPTGLGMAATNPLFLPAMVGTSPRIVGEAAYYAGKVGNKLKQTGITPRGLMATGYQGRNKDQ